MGREEEGNTTSKGSGKGEEGILNGKRKEIKWDKLGDKTKVKKARTEKIKKAEGKEKKQDYKTRESKKEKV